MHRTTRVHPPYQIKGRSKPNTPPDEWLVIVTFH